MSKVSFSVPNCPFVLALKSLCISRGLGGSASQERGHADQGKGVDLREGVCQMNSHCGFVEHPPCGSMHQRGKKVKWMLGAASDGLSQKLEQFRIGSAADTEERGGDGD